MIEAPYSPGLAEDGKDTPDYRKSYLTRMMDWRTETKEQAFLNYKNSPEYNNIDRYIRYIGGEQWDQRRPKYRSRYVDNKIDLTRREHLALLTDLKPIAEVTSSTEAYAETAETIQKTLMAEWIRNDESDTIVDLVDIAKLHGIAFARIGAASPGYSTVLALGPDNVMPIQPSLRSIQDSTAVFYRNWKPISYFKKVFPMNSEGIEKQAKYAEAKMQYGVAKPSHIPDYTWSQMSPGFKRLIGVKQLPEMSVQSHLYGSLELEEYYVDDLSINESNRTVIVKDPYLPQSMHNWWYEVKPGQRLYPKKRLIIYGGDRLLYDGPSPFWHGLYPFVDLKLNPVPFNYYGYSSYRPLIPLQDAINEVPAGVLDLTKRALNPVIITKTNVASDAAWREYLSDMPGAKLKVNPNVKIGEDIQYGAVPKVPQYVGDLYKMVIMPEFDKQAGTVDLRAISQKNQMPSGDTMDQMKDALQTTLRREERFLESFLKRCGQQKVSNVIQFYTAQQRMRLLGADGLTWEDFTVDPGKLHPSEETPGSLSREQRSSFWKQFAFSIQPGSLHSGAHDKKKMESIGLASRGLISKQKLLRDFGYSDVDIEKMIGEMMQEAQFMGGAQPPPGAGVRTPRTADQKNGPSAPVG